MLKRLMPIVLLLAAAGAYYGYTQYNKPKADLSQLSANLTIAPLELLTAFSADEQKANTDYLNKIVEIKGTIAEAPQANADGIVSIMLQADDAGGVNCELSPDASKNPINTYQTGQEITLKGSCSGYNGIDVVLSQCVVVK